jgi:hypothetical protein
VRYKGFDRKEERLGLGLYEIRKREKIRLFRGCMNSTSRGGEGNREERQKSTNEGKHASMLKHLIFSLINYNLFEYNKTII